LRSSSTDLSTSSPLPTPIEKPNHPPPNIPNRAPPIGFNMNALFSEDTLQQSTDSTAPYPILGNATSAVFNKPSNSIEETPTVRIANIGFSPNSDHLTSTILLTSSTSSSSSTFSEAVNSSPSNTLSKQAQVKPIVPKKPNGTVGLVAAHINKFQAINNEPTEPSNNDGPGFKSPNEITSL
jgi:hypothetical protein